LASLGVCTLDGRRVLVVGGLDGECSVWDLDAGEHRFLPAANGHSRPVERVVTGGREQPLAVFGTSRWGWDDFTDSTVEFFFAVVYDVALGREVFQVPCLDVELVYVLGTAGADWLLAVSTEDEGTLAEPAHAVRLFDAVTGKPMGRRLPPTGDVIALAVGQCAGRPAVASAGQEGSITVWDALDGQVTLHTQLGTAVHDLAFLPGGDLLLATVTGLHFLSLTA
jgi:WD40 repeat protein